LVETNGDEDVPSSTILPVFLSYDSDGVAQWAFHFPVTTPITIEHPFKIGTQGSNTVSVGTDRGTVTDRIDIYDAYHGQYRKIQFTTADTLALPAGVGLFYVYYRLLRTNTLEDPGVDATVIWNYELVVDTTLPDFADEDIDNQDRMWVFVGTVTSNGSVITDIGQSLMSCPIVFPRPLLPPFGIVLYEDGLWVTDGEVTTDSGVTIIPGAEYDFTDDITVYVEISVLPGAAPVIVGTLQDTPSEDFEPYEYDALNDKLIKRLAICEILEVEKRVIPLQYGRTAPGTMYIPDFHTDIQYQTDPRPGNVTFLGVKQDETLDVGTAKDLFFDGRVIAAEFTGGPMVDDWDIKTLQWGGETQTYTKSILESVQLVGNNIVFTTFSRELESERGLVQEYTDTVNSNISIPLDPATILCGDGIDVEEVPAGTFTISALIREATNSPIVVDLSGGSLCDNWYELDLCVDKSIEVVDDCVQLVNDEDAPGSAKYYGTDCAGAKGWQGIADLADSGTWSIDWDAVNCLFKLENDENLPGNGQFYGTDCTGAKGWFGFSDIVDSGTWSIDWDAGSCLFKLENDENLPGDGHYYGTDCDGLKGWFSFDDRALNYSIDWDATDCVFKLFNDEEIVESSNYYGTDCDSNQGWHDFDTLATNYSVDWDETYCVFKLFNDEEIVSAANYYGTDCSSNQGWHDISSLTGDWSVVWDSGTCNFKLYADHDPDAASAWTYYGTDGSANQGWQTTTLVTVVSNVRLNNDGSLDIKTTDIRVFNSDTETDWAAAGSLPTTECPEDE